jgi:hypothetical protein
VVDHPGLVEEHRRVLADLHGARVRPGDQSVQGERASGKRGAVCAKSLRGGARHGNADSVAADNLLCTCGRVDHDALASADRADENRDSLRPCQCSQRLILLGAQASGDALGDLARGVGSGGVTHIPPGRLGERGDPSLDRLLLGANRECGHPSALQAEDPPVTNHSPRDPKGLIRRHLPGGLLQHDAAQVALVEDGLVLGQALLHPILDRTLGPGALGAGEQLQRLVWPELVSAASLRPDTLQVAPGGEGLGAAVLERQLAQLSTLRHTTMTSTEPLRRPGNCPGRWSEAIGSRARVQEMSSVAAAGSGLADRV